MSILEAFDPCGREIISPTEVISREDGFPHTVIGCLNARFVRLAVKKYHFREISYIDISGAKIPIYAFEYNGIPLGCFHSPLGGPASVGILEEMIAKGAQRLLYFGACGSLDRSLPAGKLIIPEQAYRDEGTSYHYAPPSDYINVPTADVLSEIFSQLDIPFVKTKTWTTDGFYRETSGKADKRRSEGCGVVDMECASLTACAQFRNVPLFQFLYTADCLDGEQWDKRILGTEYGDLCDVILTAALETAVRIDDLAERRCIK